MSNTRHPAYLPYLYLVAVSGLAALALSICAMARSGISYHWMILASLTILTSGLAVKIPEVDFRISIDDTFFFSNLILFGPEAGCITAALQGLTGSLRAKSVGRRLEFTCFNVGALALSAYISGHLFFRL
ncbi:MAG TPA: hypothetical protein VE398_26010, partial [Acidobacteriota bacterium]|nr:hypothetical protein [Acidobacteriota bacterium]